MLFVSVSDDQVGAKHVVYLIFTSDFVIMILPEQVTIYSLRTIASVHDIAAIDPPI